MYTYIYYEKPESTPETRLSEYPETNMAKEQGVSSLEDSCCVNNGKSGVCKWITESIINFIVHAFTKS